MSGEGPESIPTSADPRSKRPTKKRALSPVSAQSKTVEALFAKPDQDIRIPGQGPASKRRSGGYVPPEIVANVQGSSAGAGSGEFHVYKAARRREYERLRLMEQETSREKGQEEFERKREEDQKRDEEKTRKNREKRDKAKARKKQGGKGKTGGGGGGGGGGASAAASVTNKQEGGPKTKIAPRENAKLRDVEGSDGEAEHKGEKQEAGTTDTPSEDPTPVAQGIVFEED